MKKLWNTLLDKSIFFSFDRSGFKRHKKEYFDKLKKDHPGTIFITGGTSGIGEAVADFFEGEEVFVVGRNKDKYVQKSKRTFIEWDVSCWSDIDSFISTLPIIDNLILNAGAMPSEYKENSQGVELQCASQLLGHIILFHRLNNAKKLSKNAKIIITSSGGMLLKKLNLKNLFSNDSYDKVATYANVKRAQVIMGEILAKKYPDFNFATIHPGWVETKAVKDALPGFYTNMGNRLRTTQMGADTICFLICHSFESGHFWFDRKISKTHLSFLTKESKESRMRLEQEINKRIENFI